MDESTCTRNCFMTSPTETWNYTEIVTCLLRDQSRYIGNIVS